jgi:hypothetical protein
VHRLDVPDLARRNELLDLPVGGVVSVVEEHYDGSALRGLVTAGARAREATAVELLQSLSSDPPCTEPLVSSTALRMRLHFSTSLRSIS